MLLVEDRLKAAKDHLDAGRADSAAILYESVLDLSPGNADALKGMSGILVQRGEWEQALALARDAAGRSAGDPDALCQLAAIALAAEKADTAEVAVDQALTIDPRHADSCRIKATFCLQAGDPAEAERLLQAALDVNVDDPELLAALSEVYAAYNLAGPALELAQRALDQDIDRPAFLALVGARLAGLGDHAKALPFLERAYLVDPADPVNVLRLADTLFALGELSEAQRFAKRAVALFPQFLPAWSSYLRVMTYRGEAKAALAEFAPIAKQHSDRAAALTTLAAAYRVAGETGTALRLVAPLWERQQALCESARQQARALLLDCRLTLGWHEALAELFDDRDLPDPDTAVDHVIEPGMSSLEAFVLSRFVGQQSRCERVFGLGGYGQLVGLADGVSFVASDAPLRDDPDNADQPATVTLPLSAVLATRCDPAGLSKPIPYVMAPQARRDLWQRSLARLPRPLVAISWDVNRPGLMLDDLGPVLDGFEGTLVSVQWDEARHQLSAWPDVIDAGVHFQSLGDLAAVLAETDAIVGPDGIPLHLAGAMGRPGGVLTLPNAPWYWHAENGSASWYPSISVLPAPAFGHWARLLPEMRSTILTLLRAVSDRPSHHSTDTDKTAVSRDAVMGT